MFYLHLVQTVTIGWMRWKATDKKIPAGTIYKDFTIDCVVD